MVGTAGSSLGASMRLAQESRGGEQEFPSPHGQGICLVHRFPPPPSVSMEEEQVHREERARSQGSKQDAGTQRQRKNFPRLPPPQRGAKQRAARVKGGHTFKELKWATPCNHSLKTPTIWFWSDGRMYCMEGPTDALRSCLSRLPVDTEEDDIIALSALTTPRQWEPSSSTS